ncbi:MAG TPA: hypothetical protein VND43_07950 [Burkholderiales bacterium]|nr:hypothetical protein [Burkholderiales bacterium]
MNHHYAKLALAVGMFLAVTGFSVGAQAESQLGHAPAIQGGIELVQNGNPYPAASSRAEADAGSLHRNVVISRADIQEDGSDGLPLPQKCKYGDGIYVPGCPAHGPY